MTYRGHVRSGQIVLDAPADLPEGAAVSVEVEAARRGETAVAVDRDEAPLGAGQQLANPSKADIDPDDSGMSIGRLRLMKFVGCIDGLPPDESPCQDANPDGDQTEPAWMRLAGTVHGLPEDAAVNLDHYLYGHPKQE